MPVYTKETLKSLMEGTLPWQTTKQIMSSEKDSDRFEKYLEILQESVSWTDRIVVPLAENLHVVRKVVLDSPEFIVKCTCGHEFCDYRKNWKMDALIYVRDTGEKMEEVLTYTADPEWCVIREYYCPGCHIQLEVEAVPPGYPVLFDFLPDLEAFFKSHPNLRRKILET